LEASRALLPLALDSVYEACTLNIKRHLDSAMAFARIEDEALAILKECLRYADPNLRAWLGHILRTYQVLRARDGDLAGKPLLPAYDPDIYTHHGRLSDAIHWAALQAVVSDLFPYARGTVRDVPAQWKRDNVPVMLQLAGCHFEVYPKIRILFEAKRANNNLEVANFKGSHLASFRT
jgi:hypothetical protein